MASFAVPLSFLEFHRGVFRSTVTSMRLSLPAARKRVRKRVYKLQAEGESRPSLQEGPVFHRGAPVSTANLTAHGTVISPGTGTTSLLIPA